MPPFALEDARRAAASVEGWLHVEEGETLYRLARACRGRGAIVEIGSWKGKSTVWLGMGSKAGRGAPVYAIDPHTGSPEHRERWGEVDTVHEFRRNVDGAGVGDVVRPLVMPSLEAARSFEGPVELLFIDGDHAYEAVKADLEAWGPRVVEGGVVAFHDTAHRKGPGAGPRRVVERFVYRSARFRGVRHVRSLTVAEVVRRATLAERARSRVALAVRNAGERVLAARIPVPRFVRSAARALFAPRT